MSQLPYLSKEDVPAEYQDIFGAGMNLHRKTLHSPKLARLSRQMGLYFRRETRLPARLCELAILRVAWLAHSEYEYSHHLKIALEAGVSEGDLIALSRGERFASDPQAGAVMDAATEIAEKGHSVPGTFARLREFLEHDQLVDLLFVISFYVGFVRFTASIALDVEAEYRTYLDRFPMRLG